MFGGSDANSDWRVRLTVPGGTIFDSSSVFAPLKSAGGLVFPYTPQINIGSSAKYSPIDPIHNNYPFQAYHPLPATISSFSRNSQQLLVICCCQPYKRV
jgi:hypothetical protein